MQSWLFLCGAIALEVVGTTSLKVSNGFSRLVPSILVFVCYFAAFTMLGFALRRIDVSVAYAIWAGVGTALVAVIGVVVFKEAMTLLKIVSIGLIVAGVVGLNLGGTPH
jgi:small multidrug resistance pump